MRYFTRGWANGDLNDSEVEAVTAAYSARVAVIEDRLPEPMLRLARLGSLHDGVIEQVTWDPASKCLMLDLVTWTPSPSQHFQSVRLTVAGALLGQRRLDTLRAVAADRSSCILYWEVDVADDQDSAEAPLILRFLFWPREELSIDFAELTLDVVDRTDDRVRLHPYFVEIAPDED